MSTHITGKCPHCKAAYRLRAHAAGLRARCKTCKRVFVVPGERLSASVDDNVVSWLSSSQDQDVDAIEADDDEDEPADDESEVLPVRG